MLGCACVVRDELSFPVELQQSLAAAAEAKRQQQIKVRAHIGFYTLFVKQQL